MSLLNDSKYGYDCHGRVLRLTLIRSPRYPHHAEPKTKTSGRYTDQGEHRFTYVLLPHVGTWREAETVRRARELNVPCVVVPGHREMQVTALLRLDAPNIQVSAITPGDTPNTVLVRLYEAHGVAGPARVQLGWPCDETCEIGLDEKVRRVLSSREGAVRLTFRPFEIKTLRLTPALTPMPALTASAKARAVSPGATPDREETSDAR